MASPHAPPSNPFDGFDTYSNVAQQPPTPTMQQHQQQQQLPQQVTPNGNQWTQQQQQMAYQQQQQQQQQQQPAMATGSPTMMQPNANAQANPFGTPNNQGGVPTHANGMVQQPQPGMVQQPPAGIPQQLPGMLGNYPPQPHQQQLVPMAPNAMVASPWALQPGGGGAPPMVPTPVAGAQPYDPLGIFGAPIQPPAQQMPVIQQPAYMAQQQQQMQPNQHIQVQTQQQHPYANQPGVHQTPTSHQILSNEAQEFQRQKQNESLLPDESEDEGLALIDVELDDDSHTDENGNEGEFIGDINAPDVPKKKTKGSKGGGGGGHNSWDRNPDIALPPPPTPGRHHAEYLSQNTSANHITSPLPKEELVHHSGYVLSRISFRTVLMRKWKQTFWIQYGPTQLLFFRTYSDYVDWLNNPYHTIKAREFLVKLRVDFVSDLKKASVMGYQVTQVRRKPYGKNVMLHFKLERWMDYGPTIAAAFAAREEEMMNSPTHRGRGGDENSSNDVAALRKIILGCMRNARDAVMVASRGQSGMGEQVAFRGRYDAENQAATRTPTSDRGANIGYHQAFSAESSDRRRMHQSAQGTELSDDGADEAVNTNVAPAPAPVIDLLG